MNDLIQDLSDPTYLKGFLTFVAEPFELAIYIAVGLGMVYLSGVFVTAIVIRFVQWALKINICDDAYSKYWMWSWFGFIHLTFNAICQKKHKLN